MERWFPGIFPKGLTKLFLFLQPSREEKIGIRKKKQAYRQAESGQNRDRSKNDENQKA